MKYVEVLPLVTTGAGDTAFTYESETMLAPGSLVLIPLKNRKVKGFVLKEVAKPKFKTRPVDKILSEEPVLTEVQIEVAQKISDYYFSTLGDVIQGMLPFDFGKKRQSLDRTQNEKHKTQKPFALTIEQEKILKDIKSGKPASKYLLFGVTGSGKTEIYLQLAQVALDENKGSIILVPEISLTPQTYTRFEERFGDTVAVWHSALKETEKFRSWQKIKSGQAKVVLGARSAIFAPLKNLGYIFIDEEHESSYKQDQNPRYETGRVAEWIADATGAKLVIGSATPKIESYFKAQKGEYTICLLEKRIVCDLMPPVKIVDLRDEFKKGNKSIFSDDLFEAANEALKQNKQVLLFVNRRGASTFVVCRDCGHVLECPNCEIPLTFHVGRSDLGATERSDLKCHHCDFSKSVPAVCPNCRSHAIRYFGLGTQRAEIEAKKMFPKARVARMDRDTTKKRGSHEAIYNDFANKDSDILIGTQLVAKGWDLPNISVVGVISADTMLNLPDFRSSERTFDLLTQVAGRTGRGYHPGQVIIQTYSPENYAIKAAAGHNFLEFYEREIKEREKYGYPPFSQLIKLTYAHTNEKQAAQKAIELAENLEIINKNKQLEILGPNPAFLPKIAGKYRYQIVLKLPVSSSADVKNKYQKAVGVQKDELEKDKLEIGNLNLELTDILKKNISIGWTVDVDPDNLL